MAPDGVQSRLTMLAFPENLFSLSAPHHPEDKARQGGQSGQTPWTPWTSLCLGLPAQRLSPRVMCSPPDPTWSALTWMTERGAPTSALASALSPVSAAAQLSF